MVNGKHCAAAHQRTGHLVFQLRADGLEIAAQYKFVNAAFKGQPGAVLFSQLHHIHSRRRFAGIQARHTAGEDRVDHRVHVSITVLGEYLCSVGPRAIPYFLIVRLQKRFNLRRAEQRAGLSRHVLMDAEAVDGDDLSHTLHHFYTGVSDGFQHVGDQLRLLVACDTQFFLAHKLPRLVEPAGHPLDRQIAFIAQFLLMQQRLPVNTLLRKFIPMLDLQPVVHCFDGIFHRQWDRSALPAQLRFTAHLVYRDGKFRRFLQYPGRQACDCLAIARKRRFENIIPIEGREGDLLGAGSLPLPFLFQTDQRAKQLTEHLSSCKLKIAVRDIAFPIPDHTSHSFRCLPSVYRNGGKKPCRNG